MARVGLRAYARHRKCALSAVQKAITTGRIGKGEDGLIDVEAADAAWASNTNAAKAPVSAVPAIEPAPPLLNGEMIPAPASCVRPADWPKWDEWPLLEPSLPAPMGKGQVIPPGAFMEARTRREVAMADMAERDLAERSGDLMPAAMVQRALREIGRIYAGARASLSSEIAPKVVGLTDPTEIARRVRAVVVAVDERIANEIAAKYTDVAGHGERSGTGS